MILHKKHSYFLLFVFIAFVSCNESFDGKHKAMINDVESRMTIAHEMHQIKVASEQKNIFPRSIDDFGKPTYVKAADWTTGFYPGCLWLMYDLTKNEDWKDKASIYTEALLGEQFNNRNQNMGLKIMGSFGNGFRLTKNQNYRQIIIQSAQTLVTRFNKNVGCIKSCDHHINKWEYPVVIDNLMNLELLFEASRLSGDPVYYNVAVQQAQQTLENHMRPDGSCFHVVDYNPTTGEVLRKSTYQAYFDSSSLSRGQAWALYGFTMIYRETHDVKFLKQAEKTAEYILKHLSLTDAIIPKLDLEASGQSYDPSAAAIIASALYELSVYSTEHSSQFANYANDVMDKICADNYLNDKDGPQAYLINHINSNHSKKNEIDKSLIYADYYFLEALNRKVSQITRVH